MSEVRTKAKPVHYIDNKVFYQAMFEYIALCNEAKTHGHKRGGEGWPRVTEYIGDCFVKIARHLAYRPNFSQYPFRDEMISDGIENCLMYADNFDPIKYKNPFAYFTQIIYFAFIRRIEREKKHLQTKYRYIEQLDLDDLITQTHDDGEFSNKFIEYLKEQVDNMEKTRASGAATNTTKAPKSRGKKTAKSSPKGNTIDDL